MRNLKIALFVFVAGCLASPAVAEDAPKDWLKGLTAVKLNISISDVLVEAGAPGAQLRKQIELRLRSAGLQIDPKLEQPVLYLEITGCRGPGTNAYAAYVCLQASENLKVERNAEELFSTVWGPNMMVLFIQRDLADELMKRSLDKVDDFLNDWLRVNPR
jgi:hypothetical protein